jgi:hypothetical protein
MEEDMRRAYAFMTFCLTLMLLTPAAPAQQEGVDITQSGYIDLKYAVASREMLESANTLNSDAAPVKVASQSFFFGRANFRLELCFNKGTPDEVCAVLELESKSIDMDGAGFGTIFRAGEDALDVFFEQAYIEVPRVFCPCLSVRVGIGDLRYTLRRDGEPFVIDIQESESFFGGFYGYDPTTDDPPIEAQVRNTIVRDTLETAGILLHFEPEREKCPVVLDVFAMTTIERGPVSLDESIYGVFANFKPFENLHLVKLIALVSGGNDLIGAPAQNTASGQDVWLMGGGFYYQFLAEDDKPKLDVFGEVYWNFGKLYDDEDIAALEEVKKKRAYGFNAGLRLVVLPAKCWIELTYWHLSGDDNPYDRTDSGFQSYENVDQFAILEDNEIGLDLDTNYRAIKLAFGKKEWIITEECAIDIRFDVGMFRFNEPVFNFNGDQRIGSGDTKLGIEYDLTISHRWSQYLECFAKFAYLSDAPALEFLTSKGKDSAAAMVVGTKVSF